jgi:hypothetical protein
MEYALAIKRGGMYLKIHINRVTLLVSIPIMLLSKGSSLKAIFVIVWDIKQVLRSVRDLVRQA